jgi:hypothetical protein
MPGRTVEFSVNNAAAGAGLGRVPLAVANAEEVQPDGEHRRP